MIKNCTITLSHSINVIASELFESRRMSEARRMKTDDLFSYTYKEPCKSEKKKSSLMIVVIHKRMIE